MKIIKRVLRWGGLLLCAAIGLLALALGYDKSCPPATQDVAGEPAMRVVVYECYGGPEVLRLSRQPLPEPAAGQVLVRVHAAGINPMDWHKMRGSPYLLRLVTGLGAPERTRLGADFAGTVVRVGAGVERFAPGDPVFGSQTGAYGEYVLVGENGAVVRKPDEVSFEQAGVVAIAGVSALQALQDIAQLQAGERVLINGASGGVGTYAVQIARAMGAEVTGVSSERNHAMLLALGAERVIDYRTTDFTREAERYDLVVDMVGNHSPRAISRVMTPGGRLVLVGGPKGDWVGPLRNPLLTLLQSPFIDQEIHLLGARMSSEHLEKLADLMRRGEVTPVIGHRFPLEGVREAVALSETRHARGKILLQVSE